MSTSSLLPDHDVRLARALEALEGVALGDAFGERFFGPPLDAIERIQTRRVPPAPWRYTDDTEMAISIVRVLAGSGCIVQDELARQFARRYAADPARGYGAGAHQILAAIGAGAPWRAVSSAVFNGGGSYGNGGGMRSAPIGAYFADSIERAAEEARRSAEVTHAHPEGQAGAVAIAVATALAAARGVFGAAELDEVARATPAGDTRAGIERAGRMLGRGDVDEAVRELGNGAHVSAQDTVPFALWCAASFGDDLETALWQTVSGLGDRDTTCAMIGGIVVFSAGRASAPEAWWQAVEPLPAFT